MSEIVKIPQAGVYIHIPYCRRKCIYCDFYTEGEIRADWPRLIDALISEYQERISQLPVAEGYTVYIGGGTPSLIPVEELSRLIDAIKLGLNQLNPEGRIVEFTLEVNPDDVTTEKAEAWQNLGIDRISMGVQTLNDDELKLIGRRHSAHQALEAYSILRPRFSNISLDLIFGLPGSSLSSLRTTLAGFAEMRPEHISAYSLMYEEKTALTRMRDMGKIEEVEEDDSLSMFEEINRWSASEGYDRYEISNYSLPGFESKHNSAYWHGAPYLGIGPSAHSFDGDTIRRWNIADARRYIAAVESNEKYWDEEHLSLEEIREERIMTELRCRDGINLQDFGQSFGQQAADTLLSQAASYLQRGELILTNNNGTSHLALSPSGIMISDEIIADLF